MIAIWASTLDSKMKNCEYPIKTQVGIFYNESEIDEYLLDKEQSIELFYSYIPINQSSYIYTDSIMEYLMRYNMLKNY